MPPSRHAATTTEQHRPPSADEVASGRAVLLAAFPTQVALPLPPSGDAVGRDWLADAGLRDREVSGRHARFFRAGGGVQIEDASSRNGTFIDGDRLASGERRTLHDGAVLRLGRCLLVFRAAFGGDLKPAPPVGRLVGPWGLVGLRDRLARIERSREQNVLVQGETGAGKELVASAIIHALGRSKKHVTVNVAGVPAGVFEAQLFGWIKGAYSDSGDGGRGVLRDADGGAVFLDEIGELPLPLQPKLLRVLENREVLPVGASRPAPVDVVIVAATNRALEDEVERGTFRRDLLARFTARVELPRLADRAEDLWAIFAELGRRRSAPHDLDPDRAEVEAVERMMLAPWPANVRDLARVLAELGPGEPLSLRAVERAVGTSRREVALSREILEQTLAACGGNQSAAARKLGISWGTWRRRALDWGLAQRKS